MPELPEVETVVRYLQPVLKDRRIKNFTSIWPKVLGNCSLTHLRDNIVNHQVADVFRRAKYIIIKLSNGFVPVHLRMTGKLYPSQAVPDPKYVTGYFELDDLFLIFQDQRKFGRIYWYADWLDFDCKHGMEPLAVEFTNEWLKNNLHTRKRQIKALLLDQHFIAGLGNIYVDEVLWLARIHPLSISNTVSIHKINMLHKSIKVILEKAIRFNGTTFINFSFKDGVPGSYRDQLKVFDRSGELCERCNATIRKIRVAGRGTHICPCCQCKRV